MKKCSFLSNIFLDLAFPKEYDEENKIRILIFLSSKVKKDKVNRNRDLVDLNPLGLFEVTTEVVV